MNGKAPLPASSPAEPPPLRILLVTTGLRMGGAEQQVAALAREYLARGHQVALISLTPDCEVPLPDAVERLMLDLHKNPLSMAQALFAARRFARQWRPDIVNAHMFHANLFARILSRIAPLPPLVCAAHSFSEGGRHRMLLYRLTNRWCTLTTQVSEASRAEMIRAGAVTADRVRVMFNGIDTEKFRPDPALRARTRAQLGYGGETRLIVTIGRLAAEKAQTMLVDAFARMAGDAPAHLLIVGDGPERGALAARIEQRGLGQSATLLGMRHDIPALLNAADLFVLSSRVEGMPLVIGEAMACGRPIVATAAPGVAELMGDVDTIVPIGDTEALARAMSAALRQANEDGAADGTAEGNAEGNADRAAAVRRDRIVKQFGIAAAADRWLALFAQLSQSGGARTGPVRRCADA
ncbi:glycosyltransferase [Cupriavidus plantarum]|uniref:glycosyltransferase n=1 Tax=Cupriavidus plantarum TaxID=942865 RepID=UPI00339D4810